MVSGPEQADSTHRDLFSDDAAALLTTAVDVMVAVDSDGVVQQIADTGDQTLGYQPDALSGQPVRSLVAPESQQSPLSDVHSSAEFEQALLAEHDRVTVSVKRADGSVIPVAFRTVSRSDTTGTLCLGREIQEYDARLRETAARANLLDSVADPLCVLDADDRIEQTNEALTAYTGYEQSELHGREMSELLPASTDLSVRSKLLDDEQEARFEDALVTDDGDRILTEAHVAALTEGGSYTGAVCVFRDISDRKQHEQDLELLKQVLTRVFRHNVRNELMVAQGHAELLEETLDEEQRAHTDEILRAVTRLLSHSEKARLIEHVIEVDDKSERDITDEIASVVDTLRDEYPDATIEAELPSEAVVTAHSSISRAVTELIENAIEHAPDGTRPHVEVWVDNSEETTTVFVEDESGGLADHETEVLETGRESDLEHSSGVGLWLIRWLVEYSDAEMIVHRTRAGSLTGIRFGQPRSEHDEALFGRTPAHVRTVSPERFHGETVISRAERLDQLEEIYESLPQTGGHSVLLKGEAGIGKTTLAEQFCDRITARDSVPSIAAGFCDSEAQPAYHAFRQVFTDLPTDREISDILSEAASLSANDSDELQQRRQALFADIAAELREVARSQPVVLLVEDMQWADQGTTDLFEYLVDEVGRWGHSIMFLGTYRTSDVEESHPVLDIADETAEAGRGTVMELEPFDRENVRSLVSYMLGVETVPEGFTAAVAEQTGGTPLFVNELTRHLVDTVGPIQSGSDLPASLDEISVPETVESAIADRLAALPTAVLPALRLGAVLGQTFSFDLLWEASEQPTDSLIEYSNTLMRRDIWEQADDEIAFAHGLVREQTLDRLDEAERERLHAVAGAAIERIHGDELDEYAGKLGHHYEQVGDYETAIEYYQQAGEYAAERYANDDAVDYYRQALELAQACERVPQSTRAAISNDIGDVFEHRAEYGQATEYYEESLRLRRENGNRKGEADSLHGLGSVAEKGGAYDRAEEYYQESLALYREMGNRSGEADSLHNLGSIAEKRGAYDRATEYHRASLEIDRESGDRRGEAASLYRLGTIASRRGAYDRAREYTEESLALHREIGDRKAEAYSLHSLGSIAENRGAYDRAREYIKESLELKREIGDRRGEAHSLNNLGNIAKYLGAYTQAREYYEESLELKREIGDRRGEAASFYNLGCIAENRGAYDQAREYYEAALEIDREMEDPSGEAASLGKLGTIAMRRGAYDRAEECYEESLALTREIGDRPGEATSLHNLGTIAQYRSNLEQAKQFVTDAVEIAREGGDTKQELVSLRRLAAVTRQLDADEAATHLDDALDICDSGDLQNERAKTHLERVRLALDRDSIDTARESIQQAHSIFSGLDATHFEARATLLRGRIAARTDSPDEAREYWETALDTFEELDTPQDALKTLQQLVETCTEQGDQQAATAYRKQAREILKDAPEAVEAVHGEWLDG